MLVAGTPFHLAYCSNIHAGEHWQDVNAVLTRALPVIRSLLGHHGPLAVGLRLSAAAAAALEEPGHLTPFRRFLHEGEYYVPTINGFPYGAFHGTRVKELVYEPDWRTVERLEYSNRLARIVASLAMPAGPRALSVSTVPGAFRAAIRTAEDVETIARNLLTHAAYLKRLHQQTGQVVTLAVEPEPACFIETTDEAVAFFRDYLFATERIREVGEQCGITLTRGDVAEHVGLCLDVCHMAVEFEHAARAIGQVTDAGIRIAKVQLSSALRLTADAAHAADRVLGPFAEDTYLHQVVVAGEQGPMRYVDLPEALRDSRAGAVPAGEWRVHFHVPIFVEHLDGFGTTQGAVKEVLQALRDYSLSPCLEVETYTWDVLPSEYRTSDVCTAIARELAWVRDQLSR